MKAPHVIALAVALLLVGWLGYQGSVKLSANADLNAPEKQPPLDVNVAASMAALNHPDGHPGVVCEPHQHYGGYVFTPHRFPRTVGGEITNAIHHGYSSMRVPGNTADAEWVIAPPSEVMW